MKHLGLRRRDGPHRTGRHPHRAGMLGSEAPTLSLAVAATLAGIVRATVNDVARRLPPKTIPRLLAAPGAAGAAQRTAR